MVAHSSPCDCHPCRVHPPKLRVYCHQLLAYAVCMAQLCFDLSCFLTSSKPAPNRHQVSSASIWSSIVRVWLFLPMVVNPVSGSSSVGEISKSVVVLCSSTGANLSLAFSRHHKCWLLLARVHTVGLYGPKTTLSAHDRGVWLWLVVYPSPPPPSSW